MLATTGLAKYQVEVLSKYQMGQTVLFCLVPILCLAFVGWVTVMRWMHTPVFVNALRVAFVVVGLMCVFLTLVMLQKIRRGTKIFGPHGLHHPKTSISCEEEATTVRA